MAANPPPDSYKHPRNSRVNQPTVETQGLVSDKERKPRPFSVKTRRAEEPEPRLAWDRQGATSAGDEDDHGFASTPLYTREKVNPLAMIEQLRKPDSGVALDFFGDFNGLPPDAQRWEFYQHSGHWQNRLIHGDSSQVMQSLINRDGLAGCVQMIYCDPPYGIGFNSNFMNDSGKLDSTDVPYGDTAPVRAFRDTYKNAIHSYLDEVHERLVLFRELLTDSGSVFMQIGDENVHRLATLMDEVFGPENRIATIQYATTGGSSSRTLPSVVNYLLWYGKDNSVVKYCQLYEELSRTEKVELMSSYAMVELGDGTTRKLTREERLEPDKNLPSDSRIYIRTGLISSGHSTTGRSVDYWWNGKNWPCLKGSQWSISKEGLDRLAEIGRLDAASEDSLLMWKKYEDEMPGRRISNLWHRRMFESKKRYVVQTAKSVIERCILMATSPGDLVLDPTCGSGATATCAEHWGRRFITIDCGRVAIAIARRHLITTVHPWYRTKDGSSDPSAGLEVETFQRVSAATLAYEKVNDPENTIPLVDRPKEDKKRHRLTGPFTVESASPFKYLSFSDEQETSHQNIADPDYQKTLIEEMEANGINNAERQKVFEVADITPWPKGRYVTHEAICYQSGSQKRMLVAIMLAAADVTVSANQIAAAASEARLAGTDISDLVVVASEFDNNAPHEAGTVTVHKVVPDRDMQIPGLKKNDGQSTLTLLGEPDVEYRHDEQGNLIVELKGYDTYDPASGRVKPSKAKDVDCWMIDTDHDGSAFFPRLVYLPAYRQNHPQIKKLMKALGKDLSPDAKEALCGLESQPFAPPKPPNEVAVKIITRSGAEMTTTKRFD